MRQPAPLDPKRISAGMAIGFLIWYVIGIGFIWRRAEDVTIYEHHHYDWTGPLLWNLAIGIVISVIILLIIYVSQDQP